jgi:hypothetical protein
MGEHTTYIQWRRYFFWSTGRDVTVTTRKRNYKPLKKINFWIPFYLARNWKFLEAENNIFLF